MTRISHVSTKQAAAPGAAYSQAVTIPGLVFTAGQTGADPSSGQLAEGLEQQVELAIDNLAAVLAAAGSGLDRVIKTTCFLRHIEDFPAFNAIYARRFPSPLPARSTVGVVFAEPLLFEIEAVALRDGQ